MGLFLYQLIYSPALGKIEFNTPLSIWTGNLIQNIKEMTNNSRNKKKLWR